MPETPLNPLARAVRLLIVALAGLLLGAVVIWALSAATAPRRTTPVHDPPVLAGQQIPGYCSGGSMPGAVTPWF